MTDTSMVRVDARIATLGWIQNELHDVHAIVFSADSENEQVTRVVDWSRSEGAASTHVVPPADELKAFEWSLGDSMLFQDRFPAEYQGRVYCWFWVSSRQRAGLFELEFLCVFPREPLCRSPEMIESFAAECVNKMAACIAAHLPVFSATRNRNENLPPNGLSQKVLWNDPKSVTIRANVALRGARWEELFQLSEELWQICRQSFFSTVHEGPSDIR
jgi:hypothetical protein